MAVKKYLKESIKLGDRELTVETGKIAKQADGSVMPWLNVKQVAGMIEESIVSGGMLPKLEACTDALKHGVGRVRILPASQAEILPLFYFSKLECGTEVLRA